jgi:hypothetical protein
MVKGTRLESKFPHLQTSPLRKGWIFFVQEEGPPGTRVNSVWPYPLLYGTPLPPHIPPYIGVFWVLVEGGHNLTVFVFDNHFNFRNHYMSLIYKYGIYTYE